MIDCCLCMTIHMYSTYLDSVFTLLVDSVRVCGGGGGGGGGIMFYGH